MEKITHIGIRRIELDAHRCQTLSLPNIFAKDNGEKSTFFLFNCKSGSILSIEPILSKHP